MPCKQTIDILFLFMVTVYFYTFQICYSVNVGQRDDDSSTSWKRIKQDNDIQQGSWRKVEKVIRSTNVRTSSKQRLNKFLRESDAFPKKPRTYFSVPKLSETGRTFAPRGLSWAAGNVSVGPSSSAPGAEDGYQADFIVPLDGVHGEVLGPSLDSSQHLFEWLAMRPVVQCDDDVMVFTAIGQGFTDLLVDREGASPISLFQLPPHCRYSVRKSWTDLKMVVPYDACYMMQENGSFVLPMLWLGFPLKLSCPLKSALAMSSSLAAPSVFCSSHAMAVQIYKKDIQLLAVKVNGGWGPFLSEECAYLDESELEALTFFIPYSAACVINGDNMHLHLTLDERDYILSCPASHTTSSPSKPQFPYVPDRGNPAPTTPTEAPAEEQIAQYPYYLYPGFELFHLPQVYPPGPQPARPPRPPQGSPPGPQHQQQQIFYLMEPEKFPYSREFLGMYYPSVPSDSKVTQAPTPAATTTTVTPATLPPKPPKSPYYFEYHSQIPYFPNPMAAPVTEAQPPTPPPASPPKQQVDAHYEYDDFYPFRFYTYPYGPFSYLKPGIEEQTPTAPPPTATTTTRMVPRPPGIPRYPQTIPQKPAPMAHLNNQCIMGWMVVYLPFAHPDSIQVRDHMKTWMFLSSVSPLCGYMIQMAEGSGVIFHSPLPACHSQSRTPTTISLPLRFWDISVGQYRTVEPQCAYESVPEIPVPPSKPDSPSPPSVIKETTSPSVLPKPKVSCSSHQMTLELPPGPISGIVVKDIKGNQISLQDAPKHCGYSARKGKYGKIHLSLQLHSRCHMSMQGKLYIISVIYVTENGIREGQFSCPVVISRAGKECNLPSQQRLSCGSDAVSHQQCLSMGCCYSKQSPACYYPMDECTIDRHFVFSVPASLTEPPLSPSMLVTAGNSTCKPQKVTPDFALFKIPMDGCGTRRVRVGQAVIYMVEVINKVHSISLNYGTITRDSPVRLLVECRFLPGTVLTVGYMVKTPTLGPGVQTQGIFGVQLRIAKDAEYSSYYPQYHQPLQMLLGKPLYLEVRLLNSPDPSLVLLVHFCVAYPRSATAVWVLLYNGCPNPLDPAPQQTVLSDLQTSSSRSQTRRFTISTFQFLPDGEFMDPDEEIYFMCSTEICSPRDGPCIEGCFGQ